jgi:hypothetical protein
MIDADHSSSRDHLDRDRRNAQRRGDGVCDLAKNRFWRCRTAKPLAETDYSAIGLIPVAVEESIHAALDPLALGLNNDRNHRRSEKSASKTILSGKQKRDKTHDNSEYGGQ